MKIGKRARSSILIYEETGTGKELLAQSIHQFGKNGDAPFVAVNSMTLEMQSNLLRVLQNKKYRKIGSKKRVAC